MEPARIRPEDLTPADYEAACRVLYTSVRRFLALPGIQEEYEEWMKTEEGQRSELSPKERAAYDLRKQKERRNEQ